MAYTGNNRGNSVVRSGAGAAPFNCGHGEIRGDFGMSGEEYMLQSMIEEYNFNARNAATVGKHHPDYRTYTWCAVRLYNVIMFNSGDSLELKEVTIETPSGEVTYERIVYKG